MPSYPSLALTLLLVFSAHTARAEFTIDIQGPGGAGTSAANPQIVYAEKDRTLNSGKTFALTVLIGASEAGSFGDVELVLNLPVGVMYQSATVSGFTFVGGPNGKCLPEPGPYDEGTLPTTCRWTRSAYTASSGVQATTIILKSVALRRSNGASDVITGTFGTIAAANPATDTHYIETRTTAGLVVSDASTYRQDWASRYAVVDGVQGYVRQYYIYAGSVGTGLGNATVPGFSSNPIDSIKLKISLPGGSDYTALRLVQSPAPPFTVVSSTATDLVLATTGPWTVNVPGYAGGGDPNRNSTAGSFYIEAFVPCSRFPGNDIAPGAADITIEVTDFVSKDAQGNNMSATLIGSSITGALGNIACADMPLDDNPYRPGIQDPLEGGDLYVSEHHGLDQVAAGGSFPFELTLRAPVGEPVIWDLFFVDRLPAGFWQPGAVANYVTSGPEALVKSPRLHYYACNLSGTPLALVDNFTRADLETALSFTSTTAPPLSTSVPLPPGKCAISLSDGSAIPSGTTHYVIDGAQRAAAALPRPVPYDPLDYDQSGNDWIGFGALTMSSSLTFPVGVTPNPTFTKAWFYGVYDLPAENGLQIPAVVRDRVGSVESFAADGVVEVAQVSSQHGLNGPASTTNTDSNTWVVAVLDPPVAGNLDISVYQDRNAQLASGVPITLPNPSFILFGFTGLGLNPPRNPTLEIVIPPGFDIMAADSTPSTIPITVADLGIGAGDVILDRTTDITVSASCGAAPNNVAYQQVGDAQTGYTLTWSVGDNPAWVLASSGARCAGVAVELVPASGSQFEDGQSVTFTSRLFASNAQNPGVAVKTLDHVRTIGVSAAVDLSALALSCDPAGARLTVTLVNSGGKRFTATGVRLTLPDGLTSAQITSSLLRSGSATFLAATPTVNQTDLVGSTQEIVIAFDGVNAGDTVLAPYTSGTLSFVVPWNVAQGMLAATARSFATAVDYLGNPSSFEQTSASQTELDPTSCPGSCKVVKKFGSGGPPMAGVQFVLDGQLATTGANGEALFGDVPPGTHLLTEVMSSLPGDASWSSSLGTGQQITVTAYQTTIQTVVNVCSCGDENECTTDTCTIEGSCAYASVDCSGTTPGRCEQVVCDPTIGCTTAPDLPDECAPPNDGWVFYVALEGPNGPKAVRCVLSPSAPDDPPACTVVDEDHCGAWGG